MKTTLIRRPLWSAVDRPLLPAGLFEDFFDNVEFPGLFRSEETGWVPALDVRETDTGVTVRVDVPGVDPEAIRVSVEGNVLSLEGERSEEKEETEGRTFWVERFSGSFKRRVKLPAQVDQKSIKAAYKKGVLEITCSYKPESLPRKIEVQTK